MGEKLVPVTITGMNDVQTRLVDAIIHEGELRERERIIDRLEAQRSPYEGANSLLSIDYIIDLIKKEEA